MKEINIYYIKNNLEIMKKIADLRKDLNSDLSIKYTLGFMKHNDNLGVIHIKALKENLNDFINRNKDKLKNFNGNIVIA